MARGFPIENWQFLLSLAFMAPLFTPGVANLTWRYCWERKGEPKKLPRFGPNSIIPGRFTTKKLYRAKKIGGSVTSLFLTGGLKEREGGLLKKRGGPPVKARQGDLHIGSRGPFKRTFLAGFSPGGTWKKRG